MFTKFQIARDGSRLDEGLAFPSATFHIVIRKRAVEAHAQRSPRAFRPQSQIYPVGDAQVGRLCEESDDFFREPLEVLLIGHGTASIGLAVLFVKEDKIDIAGIVQLDATEFAKGEDDEAAALAIGAERNSVRWFEMATC